MIQNKASSSTVERRSNKRRGGNFRSKKTSFIALLATMIDATSGSWIDVDTPKDKMDTVSLVDGTTYKLVMSDEFNVPNRTFKDGDDPIWTALDKSDDDASSAGGGSLHFYNSSTVTTDEKGRLKISTIIDKTEWTRYDPIEKEYKDVTNYYKSGMVQSWNKFCFTGGIVEVDVIFPGDPFVGGLWPAVWLLGNLGRATYEGSTNNIWPWSYDTCDRDLQEPQAISACNSATHYGLNKHQGRGATEIDIIEGMMGDSGGPLPSTDPPISIPYADMTLQVAPGVKNNRPQSGAQPLRHNTVSSNGHTEFIAQTWYEGLEYEGNTSLNPFFYGTYLAETKKNEPVSRTKKQAFQADAVGALHQLVESHFNKTHTFRLEWQPGRNGRLDWYAKGYKVETANGTVYMEGDGLGQEWVHAFSIKDKSINDLMGSQIPNEPSYLILNTAVSSTWGFPYDVPDWCEPCYDCDDPECACSFAPGFCNMLKKGDVAMYVDSVRVYQSEDHSAHVGNEHTLGCDPPEYPTTEYIKGHEYLYMRAPPFGYEDKKPLRRVQKGGGKCETNEDCGGITEVKESKGTDKTTTVKRDLKEMGNATASIRGECVMGPDLKAMFTSKLVGKVCRCKDGFTGPHCLALDHKDESISAYRIKSSKSLFDNVGNLYVTPFMIMAAGLLLVSLFISWIYITWEEKRKAPMAGLVAARPTTKAQQQRPGAIEPMVITGRSI